ARPADRDADVPEPNQVKMLRPLALLKNDLPRLDPNEAQPLPEKRDAPLVFFGGQAAEKIRFTQRHLQRVLTIDRLEAGALCGGAHHSVEYIAADFPHLAILK